jgi:class 3 adenylate cyclase
VNVAARIVDQAGPGEVLISEPARAAVGDRIPGICFDELGPVVMKGIPEPIRLWRASRS